MTLELILVAAFALFAALAWILITDSGRREEFYRRRYRECVAEFEIRSDWQRSDAGYADRLWVGLDTRRMEVERLERDLENVLRESEAMHVQLSQYWLQSN